jgi:O-methyltransferase involved in polyketide biosynthesis
MSPKLHSWSPRDAPRKRSNPLYCDPLALKVAGDRGNARASMSRWMMAIRTRVIDDLIREALADGVDLILNLGAGLDTRPYRMTLPSNLYWV